MYIYKITNLVNKWVYIGLTTQSPEKRWQQHLNSAKKGTDGRLYRAMRKHGIEKFEMVVIASLYELENVDILFKLEKHYIKKFNSYWFGYNNTTGGKGFKYNRPKRGRKPKKQKKDK